MFVELAESLMIVKSDISNQTINTLITMIVVPFLWILRGLAIIGILYPIFSTLFLKPVSINSVKILSFAILWTIVNIWLFINDSISSYWKWVWVDILGLVVFTILLFIWNNRIVHQHYKKMYLQNTKDD